MRSWDERLGSSRGTKNRECWFEARDWLTEAGFVEGCHEFERFVMARGEERSEFLGQTGPQGSWYGGFNQNGRRRLLRGPKRGLRLFKTARACLEALEREVGHWEVLGMLCGRHDLGTARRLAAAESAEAGFGG